MRRVVVLAEAAEDLEQAREFYDAREAGVVAVLDLRQHPNWIRGQVRRRQ